MATKPTDDDGWGEMAESEKAGDQDSEKSSASKEASKTTGPSAPQKTDPKRAGKVDGGRAAQTSKPPTLQSKPSTSAPPASAQKSSAPLESASSDSASLKLEAPKIAPSASTEASFDPDPWDLPPDESWGDPPAASLNDAVGAETRAPKDKPARPPLFSVKTRNRLILLTIVVGIIGSLVIVSWFNSRHLYLSCGETTVSAERGRFFPWGRTNLSGERWKPIEPGAQCVDRELGTVSELEQAFLDLALSHANKNLATIPPTNLDRAAELLAQAELLARAPERDQERADIERLTHDIDYWRAASDVDAAIVRLGTAQKIFEDAAGRTRHTTDAGARAEFLAELLRAFSRGTIALPTAEPTETVTTPTTDPMPATTDALDAGVATGTLLPAQVDAAPPRAPAPIPSGGVLL